MTKSRIEDMAHNIANTIEHGECFYEADCMNDLMRDINELKDACLAYERQVQSEEE